MIHYKGVTHYDSLRRRCHTKDKHKEVTHYLPCGSSTRSKFYCTSWIAGRRKERKEGNQSIFFTNSDAHEVEAITDVKKSREVIFQIH